MAGATPGGIGTGAALALTAFIGFESAAALGPETRRPYRSVSRAIARTVGGTAVLYAFAAWVQVAQFPGGTRGLAASTTPLPDLAARAGAGWLSGVLDLAIAASSFACATASATALTRLVFSMAWEKVFPAALGRTSARYRTPHVAIAVSWLAILAVPLAMVGTGKSLDDTFVDLVSVATFGYMLAYVLVCWALPRFLHRIGELTGAALCAGVAAGAVLLAVFAAYALPTSTPAHRELLLLSAGLVVAAMAGLLLRMRHRPDSQARIGVYDEPTAADLLHLPRAS
jgi:amino acid transporter